MILFLTIGIVLLAIVSWSLGRKTGYRPINRILVAFFVAASLWSTYSALLVAKGINLFVIVGPLDRDIGSFVFLFLVCIISLLLFLILCFALSVKKKAEESRQLLTWEIVSAILVVASFPISNNYSLPLALANLCLALLLNRTITIAFCTGVLFPVILAHFQTRLFTADPLRASLYGSTCFIIVGACLILFQLGVLRKGLRVEPAPAPERTPTVEVSAKPAESVGEVSRPLSEYWSGFVSLGGFIAVISVLLEPNLRLIAPYQLNRLLVKVLCLLFALPAFYLVTKIARLPMAERLPITVKAFGVYAAVFIVWSVWGIYR